MQFVLGIVALLLNIIGYIPYIRDIFRHKVKPNKVTWGVWTILNGIGAYNQVVNGGGYSALFFISTEFLVLTVFLLSFRFGVGGSSKIDRWCLGLSVLLLLYWLTLHDTRLSTFFAVIIDGLGAIPTVVKTYYKPQTESYPQWVLAGIAGFITLFAVPRLDWVLVIYPLYIVIMNGIIVGTKYLRERPKTV